MYHKSTIQNSSNSQMQKMHFKKFYKYQISFSVHNQLLSSVTQWRDKFACIEEIKITNSLITEESEMNQICIMHYRLSGLSGRENGACLFFERD